MSQEHDTRSDLRRLAEQMVQQRSDATETAGQDAETRQLVYELQVHEIELELQNEELRRAQVRTERALARYQELYEFAPVGYLSMDREGTVLETQLAGAALLGVEADQLAGRRLGVFVREADRSALAATLARVFADDGTHSCELALATNVPRFVRIDVSITPSQPGCCRAVVWDITELMLTQLALRQRIREQHCLNRVLELTHDDSHAREVICASVAAVLPTGMQQESEAVARIVLDDAELQSPGWQLPKQALQRSITASGRTIGFVEVGYRSSRKHPIGATGPFTPEEHTLLDSVTSQLQRMLDARRVADSLSRAQRLEAVGQLTGGIAHDFNNLLTVIIGNTELLNETLPEVDPDLVELADTVLQAARRGGELTGRLLAFARKQVLVPKAVDVSRLIGDITGLLRTTLGEHIEVAFVPCAEPWPALVDPAQLESTVLNLCINARDAMPGGGRLTIETHNVDVDGHHADQYPDMQTGEYVQLVVTDTGNGIAPEHLDRVFEPFYSTKEQGKGSGLGLAMVYGFVKQSRGYVTLDSRPDEGTTVRIWLPRLIAAPESDEPKQPAGKVAEGGYETILLVEDDPLVRKYAERELRKLSYHVRTASNGPEALAILRQHDDVDLLFTDMVMPGGLGGLELAEAARLLRPGLEVLYTSGYSEDIIGDPDRLDAGRHLLVKPYRRAALARKIREALGQA